MKLHRLFYVILSYALCVPPARAAGAEPDYGAGDANTRFKAVQETDRTTDFDYLSLKNHPGPSGVPMGGIGAGCVDLAPDGHFTRIGINNTFSVTGGSIANACFFSVWEHQAGEPPRVRQLRRSKSTYDGLEGITDTTYRGLFPTAQLTFSDNSDGGLTIKPVLFAYSGLVPHDVADSSLPMVWFELTLTNDQKDMDVAAAFSWADLISRGLKDVRNLDKVPDDTFKTDADHWPAMSRVDTFVQKYSTNHWLGVRQFAKQALQPRKITFQNYNTDVVLLAESQPDASITLLPASAANSPDAWKAFADNGSFADPASIVGDQPLTSASGSTMTSAIAIKAHLKKGETRKFRFVLAWYQPTRQIDRASANPHSFFGTADYDRFYHNSLPTLDALAAYATANGERIKDAVQEWQAPILASSLPDWLKFKLINSAYTLYTQTILNRAGDFTVMEGGMGGLAGTMDQRLAAHPIYQKFFPDLDQHEMAQFGNSQGTDGDILHFDGHYYAGIASLDGKTPTPVSSMLDNSMSWVIQLAKSYDQTGDISVLKDDAERVTLLFRYLHSQINNDLGIPVGTQTYDDNSHPKILSYTASVYLTALQAGERIGQALDDQTLVSQCQLQFQQTQKGLLALWTGKFFAYGCDIDGSHKRDDVMFTGQLAGQFLSRYCGWDDIVPMEMTRSSVDEQFVTSVAAAPDFYAPKVWDLVNHKSLDIPGSRCWPFYLESYTAMLGIQAGYVDDGLNIMKHIQAVHLRHGWEWTQNLWNPAENTYMTAPVTWFISDVLAGASLDAADGRLTLGPTVLPNTSELSVPLFFPTFWARFDFKPGQHICSLTILKTFGESPLVIKKITALPIGVSSSKKKTIDIPPFTVKPGATLDLSAYLDSLRGSDIQVPVLPGPHSTTTQTSPR